MPTADEINTLADVLVRSAADAAESLKAYAYGAQLLDERIAKLNQLVSGHDEERDKLLAQVRQAEHDRDNAVHRAVLAEERIAELEAKVAAEPEKKTKAKK